MLAAPKVDMQIKETCIVRRTQEKTGMQVRYLFPVYHKERYCH